MRAILSLNAVRVPVLGLAVLSLGGCAAAVSERHYFATVAESSGESSSAFDDEAIINIFRLDVKAGGAFSNIRYIAGEYDERAVDFFFNEIRSEDYAPSSTGLKGPNKIFSPDCPPKKPDGSAYSEEECLALYRRSLRLYPLAGVADETPQPLDNFVIILSSNAEAIAETIGAFSENTVALESLNYLLNKETFDESSRIEAVNSSLVSERTAVESTLSSLFAVYGDNDSTSTIPDLALLQALAVALAPQDAISFNTIEEARAWFAARR